MKNYLLLIAFISCCLHVAAQDLALDDKEFKLNISKSFRLPDDHWLMEIFDDQQNGFLLFSLGKKDMCIQSYDKALNLTNEKRIDIANFTPDMRTSLVMKSGEKYLWFLNQYDKSKGTETLYMQEIDVKAGKLTGTLIELIKSRQLEGFFVAKNVRPYKFYKYTFRRSLDNSKVLIAYLISSGKNTKDPKQVGLCVTDENLNVISNKVVSMPYAQDKMDLWDFHVDNKGCAYMSLKAYIDKKKGYNWNVIAPPKIEQSDPPEYAIEIFRLKPGTEELKQVNLNLRPYYYHRPFITDVSGGGLMMGALYTTNPQGDISDGVLMKNIDAEGNASDFGKEYFDFPPETIKQFMTEKETRVDDKNRKTEKDPFYLKHFLVKSIFTNTGGDITLIGESEYGAPGDFVSNESTYRYADIIVLRVHANGDVAWLRKIPKRQGRLYYGDMAFASLSFNYLADGKNLYLFYSDEGKNLVPVTNDAPEFYLEKLNKPDGYLMYSKIDEAGNVTKAALINYKTEKIRFFPQSMNIEDGKFMIDYGRDVDYNYKLVTLEKK